MSKSEEIQILKQQLVDSAKQLRENHRKYRREISQLQRTIRKQASYPCSQCELCFDMLFRCTGCQTMICETCRVVCGDCKDFVCRHCGGPCDCGEKLCFNCGDGCDDCGQLQCKKCGTEKGNLALNYDVCDECGTKCCGICQATHKDNKCPH